MFKKIMKFIVHYIILGPYTLAVYAIKSIWKG